MKYKGTRWFKCDFHLHTTASKCFQDKTVSAEQWVNQAIDSGLDCVAITDHNTGAGIDEIKKAANNKNLVVFPAVEITCDTSKIHLLVLFDVDIEKPTESVGDFLIQCGINRTDFGEQTASSQKTIFDVVEIAKNNGALVIPAHIDEFNGLNVASYSNLEDFYKKHINAVHVVHKEFLSAKLDSHQLEDYLKDYYNNPSTPIDIKKCHQSVQLALIHQKAILSFSDNPHADKVSEHGLWGIGRRYSWIKMEENPTLDSLKQAFLLPEMRVKNCFESESNPYKQPDLWIKSIKVLKTHITDECLIEFSPQLNTIIGGRGSGKSSILKFIRGVFDRIDNLKGLDKIEEEHHNFYKQHDKNNGVLLENTVIEVFFARHGIDYKITASQKIIPSKQQIKIEKINGTENLEEVMDENFIDFFQFEHFSQKQIYEIADKPDSLREMIDNSNSAISELKKTKHDIKNSFLETCATIRKLEQRISSKGKLETEIKDLTQRINAHYELHNDNVFQKRKSFSIQEEYIAIFKSNLEQKLSSVEHLLSEFSALKDIFEVEELNNYAEQANAKLSVVENRLNDIKSDINKIKDDYVSSIENSSWQKEFDKNKLEFKDKKSQLSELGITQIEQFEQQKSYKEKELDEIKKLEGELCLHQLEKQKLKSEYIEILKNITQKRQCFVTTILEQENVRIKIKAFRNKSSFEQYFRKFLGKEAEFKNDIDNLVNSVFNGKVDDKISVFFETIKDIKLSKKETKDVRFTNVIKSLSESVLDEIELLMPDDEICIEYKPTGSNFYQPLSTASAGQKTTAILTFILSHGETPLILDQPEDDLDNRLIYDLIVQRLKTAKEKRQLIIVTHNANIPVNADAEYVISMDSTSTKIKPFKIGSVDSPEIKSEICNIMEGGEVAFKMRSERYSIE